MERKENDGDIKELELKRIVDTNEKIITKNEDDIKALRARILRVRGVLLSKAEEANILKSELRGKERYLYQLKAERRKLQSELESGNKERHFPHWDESLVMEMYLSSRRETAKLIQYDNALRDREIAKLERKLEALEREMSSKSVPQSQSKTDVPTPAATFLESSLTPRALAKLQRHASKYSNPEHQRKARSNEVFRRSHLPSI